MSELGGNFVLLISKILLFQNKEAIWIRVEHTLLNPPYGATCQNLSLLVKKYMNDWMDKWYKVLWPNPTRDSDLICDLYICLNLNCYFFSMHISISIQINLALTRNLKKQNSIKCQGLLKTEVLARYIAFKTFSLYVHIT